MSLLLNGGGVAQLKIIETELNNAVRGNEAQIKDVIKQLDTFVGGLDQQKSEIVRAIDNIDKLAAKLAAQKDDIAKALEALPGGLKVLADQRQQLVQMLQALSRLGRRRHPGHPAEQGRHGGQPQGARADPGPADQGRRRPAQVAAAAAHLPLLRRDDRRHEGRLHQHVGRPATSTSSNLAGNLGLPTEPPPAGGCRRARPPGCPALPAADAVGQRPRRARSPPARRAPPRARRLPRRASASGSPGPRSRSRFSRARTAPGARSTEVPHDPPLGQGPAPRVPAHHPASPSRCSRPATSGSTTGWSAGSTTSSADFEQSGGIFVGSEVSYRGVTVGRVDDLRLSKDGVIVDAKIQRGVSDPEGHQGRRREPLGGGRAVPRLPAAQRRAAPSLADGDTIPRKDTAYPLRVDTLLLDLDQTVNSVDKQDLRIVVDELGKGFADGGQDLQRLIDSGDALTKSATEALPETIKLIDDGRIVLDTQRDTSGDDQGLRQELRRPVRDPQVLRRRPAADPRPRRRRLQGARGPDQGQPGQPRGAAGQPDHRRPGDHLTGRRDPAAAGDLPRRRGRRLHRRPRRRHRPLRAGPGARPAGLHPGLPGHQAQRTASPDQRHQGQHRGPVHRPPRLGHQRARRPERPRAALRARTPPSRSLSATNPYPRAWLPRWA